MTSDNYTCDCCGRLTHIEILDARPPGGDETADFTILECPDCYGPGYELGGFANELEPQVWVCHY